MVNSSVRRLYAIGVSYQAYYSEVGKACHTGKDLTEARSPHRPLVPDEVGPGQHEPTFLRGIATKARVCKRHRFRDLYRHLDAELLVHCWGELNKSAASGVDRVTAQAYAEDLHACRVP